MPLVSSNLESSIKPILKKYSKSAIRKTFEITHLYTNIEELKEAISEIFSKEFEDAAADLASAINKHILTAVVIMDKGAADGKPITGTGKLT